MHSLFTTSENDLSVFFKSLSPDEVRSCCSLSVHRRAQDYYESDAVSRLTYNSEKTKLKAVVSENSDYTVNITVDSGMVYGSCTCSHDDVCKHIAATMLYMVDDVSVFVKSASEQNQNEMKSNGTFADPAQKSYADIEQKIRKLFYNDSLMRSIDSFSIALDNELKKLSGLEKSASKEIDELVFFIFKRVEESFERGYLRDDYSGNYYIASQGFNEFFVKYVSCLESDEKTKFLEKIDITLKQQSFSTFQGLMEVIGLVFSRDDLPNLKNVLINRHQNISLELVGKYYDYVAETLSYSEKVSILHVLFKDSTKRAIELATLHDTNGNLSKAIELISGWLNENRGSYESHEEARALHLDLLKKGCHDLSEAAADAIVYCSTETMLSKIVSMIDGNTERYESLLEEKNANELLVYLQKKKRLSDALSLIKRRTSISENLSYNFFLKHKNLFKKDAAEYFSKIIEKNLNDGTGDRYYEAIVDAIDQLASVDAEKTTKYLNTIRTVYKRRRNLVNMLNDY